MIYTKISQAVTIVAFSKRLGATVATTVTQLAGVGPALAEKLAKIGIESTHDLLCHFPRKYQDRTRVYPMAYLKADDYATVEGEISSITWANFSRRTTVIKIVDGTGWLNLRFFKMFPAQAKGLVEGGRIRAFGEVKFGPNGREMVHPEWHLIKEEGPAMVEESLTPIYSVTEGLAQPRLRSLIAKALSRAEKMPDFLQGVVDDAFSWEAALRLIHTPTPDVSLSLLEEGRHPIQKRIILEELTAHQLAFWRMRAKRQKEKAPVLSANQDYQGLVRRVKEALPFALTGAQERVIAEILTDIKKPLPMNRLVQGDVGSGKTMVAVFSSLAAVASGFQSVVMAPTEILAEQHFQAFKAILEPLGIHVVWLAGKLKSSERKKALAAIQSEEAKVVIGTHAVFQEGVQYPQLGLVVVDEQHRFGVEQRLSLIEKGNGHSPHQLVMTATPIPRTLAQVAYADLDFSVIDELPPGRKQIQTVAISTDRKDEIIARIQHVAESGRQIYWVCTLIEESEVVKSQGAENAFRYLVESLPDLNIALVHGRMKSQEKEAIMRAFKSGEYHVLVATTVIEVGVDVANATLMVIENAERLGLFQLHQLRGRVGRGALESYCVLLYDKPLTENGKRRLETLRNISDGFKIAEIDLKMRGPGEILGKKQTGLVQYKLVDFFRDKELIQDAKKLAKKILSEKPLVVEPLLKRWLKEYERYIKV